MASRGRGRGRVLDSVMSSQKAPKASQSSSNSTRQGTPKIPKNIEDLGTYLFSLNESNFEKYGAVFSEMVIGYCSSDEKLEEAVGLIYDSTVSDRDSAKLGATICAAIINYEAKDASQIGNKFRKSLLYRFQTDFKQKEALRSRSVESWLGVFSFLCHIYKMIQINAQPIVVMGRSILNSIESTLQKQDAVGDEIDCICTQLKECGSLLEKHHNEKFEEIFTELRKLIIKRQTCCVVRCAILELIELRHMNWSDPKRVLDKFYVDALADAVFEDEVADNQ